MKNKIARKMEEHKFTTRFADKMTTLMCKRDINQSELAKRTGITLASISQYVHSRQVPSIYNAYKIAKVLDVSLDELTN